MFHLTFSPMRRNDALTLSAAGDTLTINGLVLDLAALPAGATLPQTAVTCDWLAIDFTQIITAEAKAIQARPAENVLIRMRRDRAIASGLRVSGLTIATDDLSQSRIMGAALSAMLDPDYTVQ